MRGWRVRDRYARLESVIYVIGGSPRCGETMLAKRVARRLGIGWISADVLEAIVRELAAAGGAKNAFPKNYLRARTFGSNDVMYSRFSPGRIVCA
jgi:hypothetical protein